MCSSTHFFFCTGSLSIMCCPVCGSLKNTEFYVERRLSPYPFQCKPCCPSRVPLHDLFILDSLYDLPSFPLRPLYFLVLFGQTPLFSSYWWNSRCYSSLDINFLSSTVVLSWSTLAFLFNFEGRFDLLALCQSVCVFLMIHCGCFQCKVRFLLQMEKQTSS